MDNDITLTGVPFASPFLRAVNVADGQFLFAGAFASSPGRRSLPPDLFQRLAAKNLVFYHWENTAEREPMLLNLSQFGLMLTQRRQLDGNSAAYKWVSQITPSLGNTVTEITQSAPDQMTFARTAPGGFTAFELLALANWIDAPNFPGFDLKLPSHAEIMRQRHPKVPVETNAPVTSH
jgi:hypothetical protein